MVGRVRGSASKPQRGGASKYYCSCCRRWLRRMSLGRSGSCCVSPTPFSNAHGPTCPEASPSGLKHQIRFRPPLRRSHSAAVQYNAVTSVVGVVVGVVASTVVVASAVILAVVAVLAWWWFATATSGGGVMVDVMVGVMVGIGVVASAVVVVVVNI